jgi:hypothetical protein
MLTPAKYFVMVGLGFQALTRRISLRIRCARPEHIAGKDQKTHLGENLTLQ